MVFRKYKAITHFSKNNTRIFKDILNAKNVRKLPKFRVPEALIGTGVNIVDPNVVNLDGQLKSPTSQFADLNKMNIPNLHVEEHPLYKAKSSLVFESTEPFSDGVDQALNLSNSVQEALWPDVYNKALDGVDWGTEKKEYEEVILTGERYDPTLEKLPRRFDPVIFWVVHPRVHGTPVVKRGNIILGNLYRKVLFSAGSESPLQKLRCDWDEPLSGCLDIPGAFGGKSLVMRGQPHMVLQGDGETKVWAGSNKVQETVNRAVPDISPINPIGDLTESHIYNLDSILARSRYNLHLNTVLTTIERDQKHPWTIEQNAANSVMTCFGAAVAQAFRSNGDNKNATSIDRVEEKLNESPVMVKSVQLCNGKLDLVAFQLNSIKMNKSGVKNIVWLKKALPLYTPLPFWQNMNEVKDLNMETIKEFGRLILS
uniref:39S ribosomal protein L37, mitochondrial n=1 Tax=Rhabditophanes sp. KR3021 TaxID=114890 RepID=A0AC35TG58_9BILA